MITWFKTLRRIVKNYDKDRQQFRTDIGAAQNEIRYAANLIKERTDIHMDISFKEPQQVIVIGKYRNRDYIKIFTVGSGDFSHTINMLHDMEKQFVGKVKYIDARPALSAAIKRETNKF